METEQHGGEVGREEFRHEIHARVIVVGCEGVWGAEGVVPALVRVCEGS